MIKLSKTAKAFGTDEFKKIAKDEIQAINPSLLPLQQGLSLSSYVSNNAFNVVILNTSENIDVFQIKSGIFYTGIIAGCSCSDDPTPSDEQNEYCEILLNINKTTAETTITLLDDLSH